MKLLWSRLVLFAMLLVASVQGLRAAEGSGGGPADPLQPGIELLNRQDFPAAYAFFQQALAADPGSARVNYYLGMAAMGLEDYENANMAFERTLIIQPNVERARVELANSYRLLGMHDMARECVEEELARNPPENVRLRLNNWLRQMETAKQTQFFTGALSLGLQYDTNVAASPAQGMISTPGLIVPAVNVDNKRHDYLGFAALAMEHRYQPTDSRLGWRTGFTGYGGWLREEHDQDLGYGRFYTGPTLTYERRQFDLRGVVEYLELGHQSYSLSSGPQVTWTEAFSGPHLWLTEGHLLWKDYQQAPERQALLGGLSTGPVLIWGRDQLALRLGWDNEDAKDSTKPTVEEDEQSYNQTWASLRYEHRFMNGFTPYAGYRFQWVEYDARYSAFLDHRQDQIQDFTVGLRKQLTRNLSLDLSYTYTLADSTLAYYEYDRQVTSLSLTASF